MLSFAPACEPAPDAELPEAACGVVASVSASAATCNAAAALARRDDWEALFRAVTERLQQCVERLARAEAAADRVRPDIDPVEPLRDCVVALQQLQREFGALPVDGPAPPRAPGNVSSRAQFERGLASSLDAAAGAAPALAVLCIGLDGFKRINDEHGGAIADATSTIVERRLARALRVHDTVCRLDGDRFACLVEGPTDREQLSRVACKLFDAVAAPLRLGAVTLSVLPSIGIALCPADGGTGPMLLCLADVAMGHAKARQQGYAFFETRGHR